jgi:hypothetical protein
MANVQMTKQARQGWINLLRRRRVIYPAIIVALVLVYLHRPLDRSLRDLDDSDRYELFSLYPYLRESGSPVGNGEFHKHPILGSVLIVDPKTRIELNSALRSGIHASVGLEAACFDPRHGIRVTRGKTVTDFLICFECEQVEVWRDGTMIARMHTTGSPQPVFDRVLQSASVPLAPRPD